MSSPTLTTKPFPKPGLQAVLLFDAGTCLAMGIALLSLAAPLAAFTGLPARLLTVAGGLLLPCAALMFLAARRLPRGVGLARLVVLGNLAWVVASVAVLFMVPGILLIGYAFMAVQAAVVLVLAGLEWQSLSAGAALSGTRTG